MAEKQYAFVLATKSCTPLLPGELQNETKVCLNHHIHIILLMYPNSKPNSIALSPTGLLHGQTEPYTQQALALLGASRAALADPPECTASSGAVGALVSVLEDGIQAVLQAFPKAGDAGICEHDPGVAFTAKMLLQARLMIRLINAATHAPLHRLRDTTLQHEEKLAVSYTPKQMRSNENMGTSSLHNTKSADDRAEVQSLCTHLLSHGLEHGILNPSYWLNVMKQKLLTQQSDALLLYIVEALQNPSSAPMRSIRTVASGRCASASGMQPMFCLQSDRVAAAYTESLSSCIQNEFKTAVFSKASGAGTSECLCFRTVKVLGCILVLVVCTTWQSVGSFGRDCDTSSGTLMYTAGADALPDAIRNAFDACESTIYSACNITEQGVNFEFKAGETTTSAVSPDDPPFGGGSRTNDRKQHADDDGIASALEAPEAPAVLKDVSSLLQYKPPHRIQQEVANPAYREQLSEHLQNMQLRAGDTSEFSDDNHQSAHEHCCGNSGLGEADNHFQEFGNKRHAYSALANIDDGTDDHPSELDDGGIKGHERQESYGQASRPKSRPVSASASLQSDSHTSSQQTLHQGSEIHLPLHRLQMPEFLMSSPMLSKGLIEGVSDESISPHESARSARNVTLTLDQQ